MAVSNMRFPWISPSKMLKRSVNDTAIYKIKFPTISIHSGSPSHVIEITVDNLKNRVFFLSNHRF